MDVKGITEMHSALVSLSDSQDGWAEGETCKWGNGELYSTNCSVVRAAESVDMQTVELILVICRFH